MTDDAAGGVIDRYFELINAERWEEFPAIWHPEAELRAVGSRPRHGRSDIEAFYRSLFTPWQRHLDLPTRILPSGTSVTVEIRFDGLTHDGRELSFDAVDVFDIEDGTIRRLTTWYDLVLVRRLLEKGSPG